MPAAERHRTYGTAPTVWGHLPARAGAHKHSRTTALFETTNGRTAAETRPSLTREGSMRSPMATAFALLALNGGLLLGACSGGGDSDAQRIMKELSQPTIRPADRHVVDKERSIMAGEVTTLNRMPGVGVVPRSQRMISSINISGATLTASVNNVYFVMSDTGQRALQHVLVTTWNYAYITAHHLRSAETHVKMRSDMGTFWED